MKSRIIRSFIRTIVILLCSAILCSCDILMLALMAGIAAEMSSPTSTPYPTSTYYPTTSSSTSTYTESNSGTSVDDHIYKSRQVDKTCPSCYGLGSCSQCSGGIKYGANTHVCGACKGTNKCGVCNGTGKIQRTEYYK